MIRRLNNNLISSDLVPVGRNDRLYWADALLDQVGHVGIDGYDRQMFSNIGQITQPFSITIHAGGHSQMSQTLIFICVTVN